MLWLPSSLFIFIAPVWSNAEKNIHLIGLDSRRQAVNKDPESAKRYRTIRIRPYQVPQHWPPPSRHFSDEGKSPSVPFSALTVAGVSKSWDNSYPLAIWKILSPPALPQPTWTGISTFPPPFSLVPLVPPPPSHTICKVLKKYIYRAEGKWGCLAHPGQRPTARLGGRRLSSWRPASSRRNGSRSVHTSYFQNLSKALFYQVVVLSFMDGASFLASMLNFG